MPSTDFVSAGKPKITGAVYCAPLGTTLPNDASTPLSGAFQDMGYIDENGVVNSNSPTSEKIKAWGGQIVLVVQTEKPDTFKLTFLEVLNPNVLETVYGEDNVTVDAASGTIAVAANAEPLDEQIYVIDQVLKGGALKRIVIPNGVLSELGDIVYKDDEPIGYETTLDCLPDGSGNTHMEYIKLASDASISLAINQTTLSVAHGSTAQLVATTTPSGMRVRWGSSDPTKATVDQSGLVTGVASGSATITATFGGISKTCAVTVT